MRTRVILGLIAFVLATTSVPASGRWAKTIRFPEPPDPKAIGTTVGDVKTYIREVTLSKPRLVHRFGLSYVEVRGEIDGIGWGGEDATQTLLQQHYAYRLPYVLRIPLFWDGTLVVHRHGTSPIGFWQLLEANLGDRNFGRTFHESADRFVSDVALHPMRRWAFFAVNQTPIDPGGAFNTRLLAGPDDAIGTGAPVHSMLDVPIGRDTALVAKHLLKALARRSPKLTLGTGHSGGALTNFMLNAGIDHLRTGVPPVLAGDNSVRAYDPSTGRIYDGFISFGRGSAPTVPVDPVRGLSAPTVFVEGELDMGALATMAQIDDVILKGVDAARLARIYMVRSMPHIDADLVAAITRKGRDFAGLLGLPERFYEGRGDRLKPLSGRLLDALQRWAQRGIDPPASIFNGVAEDTDAVSGVDSVRFARNGPDALSFPYVDRPDLDAIVAPPPTSTQNNVALAERWSRVREALHARIGSIQLPETACRRGGFTFIASGPVGTWVTPFDSSTFLGAWGSSAGHQTCRVDAVKALVGGELYDPAVAVIDILPDEFPNVVDPSALDRLTVAILSTAGFDARRIIPATLRMAGASLGGEAGGPGPIKTRRVDVNGDGRVDLLAEFRLDRLRFGSGDRVADVWGWTWDLKPFTGSDAIDVEEF